MWFSNQYRNHHSYLKGRYVTKKWTNIFRFVSKSYHLPNHINTKLMNKKYIIRKLSMKLLNYEHTLWWKKNANIFSKIKHGKKNLKTKNFKCI